MAQKHHGCVELLYPNGLFHTYYGEDPIQLYQLYERELRSDRSPEIPTAQHGFLLFCIKSGSGTLFVNNSAHTLYADTVVFCPYTNYSVKASSDLPLSFVCINLSIEPRALPPEFSTLYVYLSRLKDVTIAENSSWISMLIANMIGECCLKHPDHALIKGMIDQILVVLYRALIRRIDSTALSEPTLTAVGRTVYAIVRYIEEHLETLKNLTSMAEELGYSYNYLSHLFRRKTGMTIQAYVSRKKIERSMEMLCDEQYSITDIAARLNYDCIQSFSKAFKKAMGVSPTEYRAARGFAVEYDH